MINRVIITGRLTATPELTKSENGTSATRFRIANNRDEKTADFYTVRAFNHNADFVTKYGRKGAEIAIDGKLRTFTNADGKTYTFILADNIQLFRDRKGEPGQQTEPAESEELPW